MYMYIYIHIYTYMHFYFLIINFHCTVLAVHVLSFVLMKSIKTINVPFVTIATLLLLMDTFKRRGNSYIVTCETLLQTCKQEVRAIIRIRFL